MTPSLYNRVQRLFLFPFFGHRAFVHGIVIVNTF